MRGHILMLLLFAANAHNILWVLGAVDENKMTKQLNRMELDQYMAILNIKSLISRILQANDKIANRLEKSEGTLELVKTQVQENANQRKLVLECERWVQTRNLKRRNFFSADGTYYYFNRTEVIWNKARDFCRERGIDMAMLKTTSQFDAVAKELKERKAGSDYWLGASDVGHTAGQFRWTDKTLVYSSTWYKGTIYKYHGNSNDKTCVGLFSKYERLIDDKCSEKHNILCQVPTALTACLWCTLQALPFV